MYITVFVSVQAKVKYLYDRKNRDEEIHVRNRVYASCVNIYTKKNTRSEWNIRICCLHQLKQHIMDHNEGKGGVYAAEKIIRKRYKKVTPHASIYYRSIGGAICLCFQYHRTYMGALSPSLFDKIGFPSKILHSTTYRPQIYFRHLFSHRFARNLWPIKITHFPKLPVKPAQTIGIRVRWHSASAVCSKLSHSNAES